MSGDYCNELQMRYLVVMSAKQCGLTLTISNIYLNFKYSAFNWRW